MFPPHRRGGALILLCLVTVHSCLAQLWSYDENSFYGPSRWGFVVNDTGELLFPGCSAENASPTHIAASSIGSAAMPQLSWIDSSNFSVVNDGNDIKVLQHDVQSTLQVTPGGPSFAFKYGTLHSPSGHSFGGGNRDLELHLVHERTEGLVTRFAVVVVTFVAGLGEHTRLQDFINSIPAFSGETVTSQGQGTLSLRNFLPHGTNQFRYSGTLIVPPCQQSAEYFVYESTTGISDLQLNAIKAKLPSKFQGAFGGYGNVRKPQPVNGRRPIRLMKNRPQFDEISVDEKISTTSVLSIVSLSLSATAFVIALVSFLVVCCSERVPEA